MKIIYFVFLSFIFTSNTINAQTQDMISLAKGNYLGMNAIYNEKGDVFGYVSIYDYGKSGTKTKKFEYVILDKNLNPVANNTFEGELFTGNYMGYMTFDDRVILRPSAFDPNFVNSKEIYTPSTMIINLKDNTINKEVRYDYDHGTFTEKTENETWREQKKEARVERRKNGYTYDFQIVEIKEGGYIVLDYEDHGSYVKNNHLLRYDKDKKELWRYEYNNAESKNEIQKLYYIERDSNYFYGLLSDRVKSISKYYLLVIDMHTGKEVHKKEIIGPQSSLSRITGFSTISYGGLDNDRTFDDKIVIVGKDYTPFTFQHVGFVRLVIDKKTFATDFKTISYDLDFRDHVDHINKYGQVEKGYYLDPRDIFISKDGSVGFLFEKFKPSGDYAASKTTDMVYVYTDKNFSVKGAKVFEKEKSKWIVSDYLFSQNINDGNDVVFFYRDYQKDDETKQKNWNLFINTLIDGKFKQEIIPISSKDNYLIIPYIAKEGYILLQEFSTKKKDNQVRLERLNY